MLGNILKLRRNGVLGLNKRNASYTLRYNKRRLYPLVDDKLKTKQLALKAGIAVPKLYGVVQSVGQISLLPEFLSQHQDFVIKPACGSGGEGIMVISGRMKKMYRRFNGLPLTHDELRYHLLNILSGMFSLGGRNDKALIEYRVEFDSIFENVSYLGVPDIRIIIFFGVPVMAMLRLPTRVSDGKANLHQGAVGAGIDLATGKTLTGVWRNDTTTEHPDTGYPIDGLQIPRWSDVLQLATKCHELTGLNYQGVDIVLDKNLGPLMLELNARPGLNIQIANHAGLLHRLKKVEKNHKNLTSPAERIQFAVENFGVSSTTSA